MGTWLRKLGGEERFATFMCGGVAARLDRPDFRARTDERPGKRDNPDPVGRTA